MGGLNHRIGKGGGDVDFVTLRHHTIIITMVIFGIKQPRQKWDTAQGV